MISFAAKAKARGKRGRVFSEGWVEFKNKKAAKKVAEALNNTLIGGKLSYLKLQLSPLLY